MDEKGINKSTLAKRSGVACSFFTALSKHGGNPSLKSMQAIANALDVPLHMLLKPSTVPDCDGPIPDGYEKITAILPKQKAFIVRRWCAETLEKM